MNRQYYPPPLLLPSLAKTADNKFVPWLASQNEPISTNYPPAPNPWRWIPCFSTGYQGPVMRDGDTTPHSGIAINIHRGGHSGTSSEGCGHMGNRKIHGG